MFRSIFFMVLAVILASLVASSLLERLAQRNPSRPVSQSLISGTPAAPFGTTGSDEIAIAPDRSGSYRADVEIEGHLVHMIVDTGASYVSLTHNDANAIGIFPAPADYKYRTLTANGAGVAAKVRISRLRLGQVEMDDVEAFVMPPGAMSTSLLGMSALGRLRSVRISNGQLVLRQ